MKDESSSEKAVKPKRRWWWLWGWAAVVVVLGVMVMRWYGTMPAHYRVVGHERVLAEANVVAQAGGFRTSYWIRDDGILLWEATRTFVYRDLEGRERWRVESPDTVVGVGLSRDGHICVVAVRAVDGLTVYTWRDGQPLSTTHVATTVRTNEAHCMCANDGDAFVSVWMGSNDWMTYLLRGGRVVAQGDVGYFEAVAPDGKQLIKAGDGEDGDACKYSPVIVTGDRLSATWGPWELVRDGIFDFAVYEGGGLYLSNNGWQGNTYGDLEASTFQKPTITHGPPPRMLNITVSHRDKHDGWTIAVPDWDRLVSAPTNDYGHVLLGQGVPEKVPDPWSRFRTWPLIGPRLPMPSPHYTLSLYNRAGKCEAEVPYRQMMDLVARSEKPHRSPQHAYGDLLQYSPDGTRLVMRVDSDIFFLRADPHPTVWQTITGWFNGKG